MQTIDFSDMESGHNDFQYVVEMIGHYTYSIFTKYHL